MVDAGGGGGCGAAVFLAVAAALGPRRHKVELRLRELHAVNAHERGWRRRRWVTLAMVVLLMVT